MVFHEWVFTYLPVGDLLNLRLVSKDTLNLMRNVITYITYSSPYVIRVFPKLTLIRELYLTPSYNIEGYINSSELSTGRYGLIIGSICVNIRYVDIIFNRVRYCDRVFLPITIKDSNMTLARINQTKSLITIHIKVNDDEYVRRIATELNKDTRHKWHLYCSWECPILKYINPVNLDLATIGGQILSSKELKAYIPHVSIFNQKSDSRSVFGYHIRRATFKAKYTNREVIDPHILLSILQNR